nr:immunoglobulin light chain junction region [Mus musculus]NSL97688.1 immunoglobulin light chain junction region [Mus musculus]NSL97943.1 immunoglobulin light chain junction region [Mus musculus]NSL98009.1 immunoglobulin light chain junction region [Mus musculus]NSL98450.1 immunoglobulin light chain junction region [Mus musculus]
CLQYASSPFTF